MMPMSVFHSNPCKAGLLLVLLLAPLASICAISQSPAPPLPDSPQPAAAPQTKKSQPSPCVVKTPSASTATSADAPRAQPEAGATSEQPSASERSSLVDFVHCIPDLPVINWYERFLNGPQVKPLTPLEKAHLAARNLLDPFNLLTIGGEAAISVAANSHSPYGPGMPGYGRYVGVSFTQSMVGEFFGTFLIPSIAHQDPHYRRMPGASIARRILHAEYQIVWTQGDNGKGMVNYAVLVGFAADDEIGNLYVPGQQANLRASAARYGIALATAPIDNFITEFLPDVARHIHVQVVIIQRIINQVAKSGNSP